MHAKGLNKLQSIQVNTLTQSDKNSVQQHLTILDKLKSFSLFPGLSSSSSSRPLNTGKRGNAELACVFGSAGQTKYPNSFDLAEKTQKCCLVFY